MAELPTAAYLPPPGEIVDPDLPGPSSGLRTLQPQLPMLPTPEMAVQELRERHQLIQVLMGSILKEGQDYGKIPGCGDKPALLLPGAQQLAAAFRLAPRYAVSMRDIGPGHREYDIKCSLYSFNGLFLGEGEGTCSTMERKYRWRPGPVENTGTLVPKAYWDQRQSNPKEAQKAIGGPGFSVKKIDNQWVICKAGEIIENLDPADVWNTVKKMAAKRAFVAAILTVTGASATFTQDIEENPDLFRREDYIEDPALAQEAAKKPPARRAAPTAPADPVPPPPPPAPADEYPFLEEPAAPPPPAPAAPAPPPPTPAPAGPAPEAPKAKEKWNNTQFGAARQMIVKMRAAAVGAGYQTPAVDKWTGRFENNIGHIPHADWMTWAQDSLKQLEAKAASNGGAK